MRYCMTPPFEDATLAGPSFASSRHDERGPGEAAGQPGPQARYFRCRGKGHLVCRAGDTKGESGGRASRGSNLRGPSRPTLRGQRRVALRDRGENGHADGAPRRAYDREGPARKAWVISQGSTGRAEGLPPSPHGGRGADWVIGKRPRPDVLRTGAGASAERKIGERAGLLG